MTPDAVVNHVALRVGVPDGLRRPDGVQILAVVTLEEGEARGEVDGLVVPMNQVGAFHEDETVVALPAQRGAHVGEHHVEGLAVHAAYEVRITDAPRQGNAVGEDHGLAVVEAAVVEAVVGDGIAYLLSFWGVVGEETEEIGSLGSLFPGGARNGQQQKREQR